MGNESWGVGQVGLYASVLGGDRGANLETNWVIGR